MDVLSLGKGLKAKKAVQQLTDRLGVEATKNGALGIVDVHSNVHARLTALEAKQKGATTQTITVSTSDEWKRGSMTGFVVNGNTLTGKGEWRQTFELGEDAIALERIVLEGTNTNLVQVQTNTTGKDLPVQADGAIASPFASKIQIQLIATATTVVITRFTLTYTIRPLHDRISDLAAHTAINLNKHQLKVNALLNQDRYRLSELVFDDFADTSGIDSSLSSGYTHDSALRLVKQENPHTVATIITTPEMAEQVPSSLMISLAYNGSIHGNVSVPLTEGTFTNTIYNDGALRLLKANEDEYAASGTYESPVIDAGENVRQWYRLTSRLSVDEATLVSYLVSSSSTGEAFSSYVEVNSDGTIPSMTGKYLRIKILLSAKQEEKERMLYDFTANPPTEIEANDYLVNNGSAKIHPTEEEQMKKEASFEGTGQLLTGTLVLKNWNKLIGIEVKE